MSAPSTARLHYPQHVCGSFDPQRATVAPLPTSSFHKSGSTLTLRAACSYNLHRPEGQEASMSIDRPRMATSNTRSRRALKPVNYADVDDDSTDYSDIISPDPDLSSDEEDQINHSVDEDDLVDDAESDLDQDMPDLADVEDLESIDELDEEAVFNSRNRHYDSSKPGFMSLPPELRLKIYKLVLVKAPCVDFGTRSGFMHSAGLLSVCKKVAEEAAMVLYSMNNFIFRPSRAQIGPYFEKYWRWVGYSSSLQFLRDIGPTNLSHLKAIGIAFQDATPSDEPKSQAEDRRFQHNADLYRSLERLVKYATNLEIIKFQFAGREKFMRKRNAGTLNFGNLLGKLKADVIVISEVKSRDHDSAEYWPLEKTTSSGSMVASNDANLWTHAWMENRISKNDEEHLISRMRRDSPLNARLREKHDRAVEHAKAEGRGRGYPYY